MRRPSRGVFALVAALVVLAAISLVPMAAQALPDGDHGVAVGKVCQSPLKVGDNMRCILRVTNDDAFDDTITILEVWDTVTTGSGAQRVPAAGNVPILHILGNASCAPGPSLPCDIGPDIGAGVGRVEFLQDIYVVQPGDPDPLLDMFTALVRDNCDMPVGQSTCNPNSVPVGFGSATNLFQPAIAVAKTADTDFSKVGDTINYTVTLSNNSSDDTPSMNCTAEDSLAGVQFAGVLPRGDTVVNYAYIVKAGDPDPLTNTVTLTCTFDELPNVLTAEASYTVDLFTPSIELIKTGDDLGKVGDWVDYTITLSNTSEPGAPDLECTITDPMLGVNENVTLASGEYYEVSASYMVQPGDPDPLINTASATCSPVGFPNVLTAEASHSVDLFEPGVMVEKDAEDLCYMVGDIVEYEFTITNTSDPGTPDLIMVSVMDDLLGDLSADASAAECDVLATGESCSFSVGRVIGADDPDPLENTVEVVYSPEGFPNEVTDSDSHSITLCRPNIELLKTADLLGKMGDAVNFTISVTNTSDPGTPDLECNVVDEMLGVDEMVTLGPGETVVIEGSHMVGPDDPDPLINTVEVTCNPPLVIGIQTSQALVELFQPSIDVDKSGPAEAEDGDEIMYQFTIVNTSSADTPPMILVSVMDDLLGDLMTTAAAAGCGTLLTGDSCNFSASRTLLASDPNPLVNTVEVVYSPEGFENLVSDSDSHAVRRPESGVGGVVDFLGGQSSGGSSTVGLIAGIGVGAVLVFSMALIGFIRRRRHREV